MTTTRPTTEFPAPGPTNPPPVEVAEADPGLALVWVEPWPDGDSDGEGMRHHLRSDYVETFWLPVLGPSSVLLLRLLATGLAHTPSGYTLDLAEAARMLGIGHRGGRNAPMNRTLERCCAFGATRLDHGHQLLVRESLPSLGARQVARLPSALQKRHTAAVREASRRPPPPPVEALRSRCRTLALSLLELGEAPEDAEVQLHRWRFHPAMAHESVLWARQRLTTERPPGDLPSDLPNEGSRVGEPAISGGA